MAAQIGIGAPTRLGSVSAMKPDVGTTSGKMARGIPRSANNGSDHESDARSNSMVRDAFVTSVTWRRPPVRFQINQESTVTNSRSPASARRRNAGSDSNSQAILVAEK